MGNPKLGKSFSGKPMHFSVGAIIKNKEGKILLVDRKNPPFGFAGLAGHIDEGEEPDRAIRAIVREVLEESGFIVTNPKLMENAAEMINNMCKHGIDVHCWFLFECECSGMPRKEEGGAHSIGWVSPAEIQQLSNENKLEPVWEFWFKRYKIITGMRGIKGGKTSAALPVNQLKCVCKPDEAGRCCDYVILAAEGWVCEKDTEMGKAIRARFKTDGKEIKDNCKDN